MCVINIAQNVYDYMCVILFITSLAYVRYIVYYITIENNKTKSRPALAKNPIGTNQKKGSSIITGAKVFHNE